MVRIYPGDLSKIPPTAMFRLRFRSSRRVPLLALCLLAAAPSSGSGQSAAPIDRAPATTAHHPQHAIVERPKPSLGTYAEPPAGTRRMAERLQELWRGADPRKNRFRSVEQAKILSEMLAGTHRTYDLLSLKPKYAQALLEAGDPDTALQEFIAFEELIARENLPLDATLFDRLLTAQATCHLRIAEQENCLTNHNADSCLIPIQGGGVHRSQRGSRGAVAVLTRLLERHPDNLSARWLLNLAYMTLGEYPAAVPPASLLPPEVFNSEHDLPRFPDLAGALGLDVNDLAGGVVMDDFDNDGLLDLMVSAWGFHCPLRLFRNNGDGTFEERTTASALEGLVAGLNLVQADYNNDGWIDVLVLRGAWFGTEGHVPNSLLRNNGDFTFTDVTEEAGLLSFHPTQTATWFDYNGDGWLDLFIGNESTPGDFNRCELYRNNGDGTFTECAAEHGLDIAVFAKAVCAGDYNNDSRIDLFVSCRDGTQVLLRNDGPAGSDRSPRAHWRFTDATRAAGISTPHPSFPAWWWDYNNDGWLDVFAAGYFIHEIGDIVRDYLGQPHGGQRARLYRNNGDGTFSDVSAEVALSRILYAMSGNFGDLDNDGWLDFYVGTGDPDLATIIPNRMFRNADGRRFQDVTTTGGFGQIQKGHGIAFGDIDNDGDQDVYSVVGGAVPADIYPNQLFANPGHGNSWITLQLVGVTSNRAAVGARIKVVARTPTGEREIHRVVGSGGSFGASPLRQEIGLGDATVVERVEIFWPATGKTQELRALAINGFYRVRENDETATRFAPPGFALPVAPAAAPHEHHHP